MPKDIAPEILRQVLRYEPETGKLFWRERSVDMFTDGKQSAAHRCAIWNGKYAGKEALTAYGYGYKRGAIFGCDYSAHRVIWAIIHGEWPDNIDHINGVRDDNRIENLRSVSVSQNNRNAKRASHNTSGTTGICFDKSRNKWMAHISVGGNFKHLGRFHDKADAIAARKDAEAKYGYHENHGRD